MRALSDDYIKRLCEFLPKGKTIDRGGEFDEMWGIDVIVLSDEQIEDMKDGKAIRFDNGEYAQLIFSESALRESGVL